MPNQVHDAVCSVVLGNTAASQNLVVETREPLLVFADQSWLERVPARSRARRSAGASGMKALRLRGMRIPHVMRHTRNS
jgi:hypothetical protein